MTTDQAIATAAHWWTAIILLGIWDNGDPESERTHALFAQAMPRPTVADRKALDAALRHYFAAQDWRPESRHTAYCDYAADWLDTVLHTVNPAWDSHFCGPQKAGTRCEVDHAGDVTVLAKHGYAKPWMILEPPTA